MVIPLAFAREGSIVKVVGIRAGRGLVHRLRELGIFEGQLLKVVKSHGPGPVVVEVLNKDFLGPCSTCPFVLSCRGRLVLSFGISMKVLVEEVIDREQY